MNRSFSLIRLSGKYVWVNKNTRPVVIVSGSHKHSCLFGALSLDGRQLFKQQYDNDEDAFYDYLKRIQYTTNFNERCYLFYS